METTAVEATAVEATIITPTSAETALTGEKRAVHPTWSMITSNQNHVFKEFASHVPLAIRDGPHSEFVEARHLSTPIKVRIEG